MSKVFRFILRTFLFLLVSLIPSAMLLCCAELFNANGEYIDILALYLISIIFIAIIFVLLFAWKKPGNLFALPLGFVITPYIYSVYFPIQNIQDSFVMFKGMDILIVSLFYAGPFTISTLAIAITMLIVTILKNKSKKRNETLKVDETLQTRENKDSKRY